MPQEASVIDAREIECFRLVIKCLKNKPVPLQARVKDREMTALNELQKTCYNHSTSN